MKVMLIDDSPFFLYGLKKILLEEGIVVAGTYDNVRNIFDDIDKCKPNAIILDNNIGGKKTVGLVHKIVEKTGIPILFYCESSLESYRESILALENGAIDFLLKPVQNVYLDLGVFKEDIISKIRNISEAQAISIDKIGSGVHLEGNFRKANKKKRIVVIASSTGGVQTLSRVIPFLPKDIPVPIVVVQHMPKDFTAELAGRLDECSSIKVKESEDNEILKKGIVYIAKGDYHLYFKVDDENEVRVRHGKEKKVYGLRPYANYTFSSVAKVFGSNALGIVLSGMGSDGTDGLRDIKEAGGLTIAQSKKNCILYGMPKSAIDSGVAMEVVDLENIPERIVEILLKKESMRTS